MPARSTPRRASRVKSAGGSASARAGEYVREEMRRARAGKHPGASRAQVVAIGLSQARRAGVDVPPRRRCRGARCACPRCARGPKHEVFVTAVAPGREYRIDHVVDGRPAAHVSVRGDAREAARAARDAAPAGARIAWRRSARKKAAKKRAGKKRPARGKRKPATGKTAALLTLLPLVPP